MKASAAVFCCHPRGPPVLCLQSFLLSLWLGVHISGLSSCGAACEGCGGWWTDGERERIGCFENLVHGKVMARSNREATKYKGSACWRMFVSLARFGKRSVSNQLTILCDLTVNIAFCSPQLCSLMPT